MKKITIREPTQEDSEKFITAVLQSSSLHSPWVSPPSTSEEYNFFLSRYSEASSVSFLVLHHNDIAGVINLNEIIHGAFQSAYLGFYAMVDYVGTGVLREGMIKVIDYAFKKMNLHRLEANIQPGNIRSIRFVEKLNFHIEGFSKKYLFINGKWRDHMRYAIIADNGVKHFKPL